MSDRIWQRVKDKMAKDNRSTDIEARSDELLPVPTVAPDSGSSAEARTDHGHPGFPRQTQPKQVTFELLLPPFGISRPRLPMRVNIFPHDTTESIVTTVKNFYGLYDRRGVTFEDRHGALITANYDGFEHNMTVYARASAEDINAKESSPDPRRPSNSPTRRSRPKLDEAFEMLPAPTGPKRLRAPRSKTARGCLRCRLSRVKCDMEKPNC